MNGINFTRFDSRHEFLASGKFWAFALSDRYEIAGSVSLEKSSDEWVLINDLFVTNDMRRRGIGKALVSKAFLAAEELFPGSFGCCSCINPRNYASDCLFRSFGFKHVYSWPDTEIRLYSARYEELIGR